MLVVILLLLDLVSSDGKPVFSSFSSIPTPDAEFDAEIAKLDKTIECKIE
jgi:hypothetical protein